jgi:heme O synthase-like polyprenyltransferase
MLPNLIGSRRTVPFIFIHAFFAVAASMIALTGIPLALAAISGAMFIGMCVYLWLRPTESRAYLVYKASNYYLMLVFVGVMV